jgi:hypothetical protein
MITPVALITGRSEGTASACNRARSSLVRSGTARGERLTSLVQGFPRELGDQRRVESLVFAEHVGGEAIHGRERPKRVLVTL